MTFLMTFLMTLYILAGLLTIDTVDNNPHFFDPKNLMVSPPRRGQCQQRRRRASCDMPPGPEIVYWVFGVSIYYSHFIVHILFILYHHIIPYQDIPFDIFWYPSFIVHFTHKKTGYPRLLYHHLLIPWGFPVFRGTGSHTFGMPIPGGPRSRPKKHG